MIEIVSANMIGSETTHENASVSEIALRYGIGRHHRLVHAVIENLLHLQALHLRSGMESRVSQGLHPPDRLTVDILPLPLHRRQRVHQIPHRSHLLFLVITTLY